MDWLTFKFCVLIWVLCVSKSQSQVLNSSTSMSNQLRSACTATQLLPPPDQCNTCICFDGLVYCTNNPCPEQKCIHGMELPEPDECNKCICRHGIVTCTKMICIPAPFCNENQLFPSQNKCNACMCKDGFILCTTNFCEEEATTTTTTTIKPKQKECIEGSRLPGPNECLACVCKNATKKCENICNPVLESRFGGPECTPGQHLPRPDECNNCICFEGHIHCTHMPCQMDTRIGPECIDDQPINPPDECNECYCFEGRLQCSNLICIRGSSCVEGQVIPKPDSCNSCKCVQEHVLCTNNKCPLEISRSAPESSLTEVMTLQECQAGDSIPPPPPPNDCNTCYCLDNQIVCTKISCAEIPEFKGRLTETNEKPYLELFDKKIPVEPFINILYTNNDKIPHKLIHSHSYNGFHQEIKIHTGQLPKDTNKLFKVLASTLNNAVLANITERLLTLNSASNNYGLKKPEDQTNQLGEGNVLSAQSSKLITSGSQSNETILVIPHTEPLDDQDSQSVLPLESKHETNWKTVSSPAILVYNNGIQILPRHSQEDNVNEHSYDNPPSIITSVDQSPIVRNPSKFTRPGLSHVLPTNPTRNMENTSDLNTQSIYPKLHPKPININDGKMIYAPLSKENKQIKPVYSSFVGNHDELSHLRPFQPAKPVPEHIFNYTSLTPVSKPGQYLLNPDNNVAQQKPLQSQFLPNPSNYYSNKKTPQQLQFTPQSNPSLPIHNYDETDPLQALFPKITNQPLVSPNEYKPSQLEKELKPAPLYLGPLHITNTKFEPHPNKSHLNPLLSNLPHQKNRISTIDIRGSKETAHNANILNPVQNEVKFDLTPNPSIYYKNEYEAPKISDENSDQDQLTPYSIISYKSTENYDPFDHSFKPGNEKLTPKVHDKTKKYNSTHSHYEKHTSITYVSEYDPNNPDDNVGNPNNHNGLPRDVNEHYSSDPSAQDLDLSKKVDYYLNLLYPQQDRNVLLPKLFQYHLTPLGQRQNNTQKGQTTLTEMYKSDPHDFTTWYKANKHSEEYPHSLSESKYTVIKTNQNETHSMSPNIFAIYLHKASKPQLLFPQDNSEKKGLNDPESTKGSQSPPSSVKSTYPKNNDYLRPPVQNGPLQNHHTLGVIDDREANYELQYSHNAYKDPRHFKPVHKLPPPKLETPENNRLPGMFDDRVSSDGLKYPSDLAENLTPSKDELSNPPHFNPDKSMLNPQKPKDNLHIPPSSQHRPDEDQNKPGVLDNLGVKDVFQYAHNANEGHRQVKPFQKISPFPPGTNHKQTPEVFDERGSPDKFRYPSYKAENPIVSRGNLHNLPLNKFGPSKRPLPGVFDNRESVGGLQNLPDSTDNSLFSKGNNANLPQPKLTTIYNQRLPGVIDGHGSIDGLDYPSNPNYNLYKPVNSPFRPTQKQHLTGLFDDHVSADGLHNPSNTANTPFHPKYNLYKPRSSLFKPGVIDNRGSTNGIPYPFNSAEAPKYSKEIIQKSPNFSFGPILNNPTQSTFGDRGSMGGLQYPINSVGQYPKHPNPHSPLGPAKHLPEILEERDSADGLQYPFHSLENPTHPRDNNHNQYPKEVLDDRSSTNSFNYQSNSVQNTRPKVSIHNYPHPQFSPTQNQHLPGIFNERGPDSLKYPSIFVKNPKDNLPNPPQSVILPSQSQHISGAFDDRGSADGFQYPFHSVENPSLPKQNKQILPNYPFGPTQNKHFPGMFDERESVDRFHYPSHSAKNLLQPKSILQNPSYPQWSPDHNQHVPGVFDNRGSTNGFQYPSHTAKNTSQTKGNQQNPSYPKLVSKQNQNTPGVFDDRGSGGGFQYPSHFVENPLQSKDNPQNPLYPHLGPNQNQHKPSVFDDRGSADGFQYPSLSNDNDLLSKGKQQNPLHPQWGPNQNQHLPGVFDDRGSVDGFQYPSHFAENPLQPKGNQQNPSHPQWDLNQNQHLPGVSDDRGSADGFQYPSHFAGYPLQSKGNQQNPTYPQLGPNQEQHAPGVFDDRGSADGFQYPSQFADNPLQPKRNQQNSSDPQLGSNQEKLTPGIFDDRGSADRFQYPSHPAKNPLQPKDNQQNPSYPQLGPNQERHVPGVFDDRGSADGFQYPSHFAENPLQPKGNQQNSSDPQLGSNQEKLTPGVFDDRGSADRFQYPSHPAKNRLKPKDNQQNPSYPQLGSNQAQHKPGVFGDRGSADGFQYPSNSDEDPLQPKGNQLSTSHPQWGPNQNQHTPGVFDDRGSADGFQYPSNSAGDPIYTKDNPDTTPELNVKQSQNQPKPTSLDQNPEYIPKNYNDKMENQPTSNNYKNNNPLIPWMYLDHDQYKPSSYDNQLNGFHNIPWSPEDHDKVVSTVSSSRPPRFEADYDQYKPSSFDNLFNGIHHVPRPVPNQDNNALGFDAELPDPHTAIKPEQDQIKNTYLPDEEDDRHKIKTVISTNLTNSDSMQNYPSQKTKPDSLPNSLLPTGEGKIPDYYDQLYPLLIALKKLSEPSNYGSGLGSKDQLDLLPILFPGIADILNNNSSQDQNDKAPVDHVIQRIFPLKKLKPNSNELSSEDNGILNWLKNKLNKPIPTKDNATETENIDLSKILTLLSKLTPNKIKQSTENIPFEGFDPEIIDKIWNDFKEDKQTATPAPHTDETTDSYHNEITSIPTVLEETQEQETNKYPEVHIILHQSDDIDDVNLPLYIENNGDSKLSTDISSKDIHSLLFPNLSHPRFKHRSKDLIDVCGDGTQWISNCHSCSCYYGQPLCSRMHDCERRPFGEPMTCKPYSHFKMGCYTCECNGDGVAECDATNCGTRPNGSSKVPGSHELILPIFHEFFDNQKTNEILQYYKFYKKLPKDCPSQDSQTEFPTCERGTSWISSCHKCECNESGKHECTKIADCILDFDSYGKPGRCKPNSKFFPKTNTMPCVECSCNDEGISYCPEADHKKH